MIRTISVGIGSMVLIAETAVNTIFLSTPFIISTAELRTGVSHILEKNHRMK